MAAHPAGEGVALPTRPTKALKDVETVEESWGVHRETDSEIEAREAEELRVAEEDHAGACTLLLLIRNHAILLIWAHADQANQVVLTLILSRLTPMIPHFSAKEALELQLQRRLAAQAAGNESSALENGADAMELESLGEESIGQSVPRQRKQGAEEEADPSAILGTEELVPKPPQLSSQKKFSLKS